MTVPGGTWIIVAAYNEEMAVDGVVCGLVALGHRVVVVDDGSTDATAQAARAAGAVVVMHPVNLGQGAALQTGIEFALRQDAAFIVTFDADGQHHPGDIARLVAALGEHSADFALGSRFLGSAIDMPASRRWLLGAATTFTRLTTGMNLTDTHNGLRAMTRRGAQAIRLRQNRMAHASEILHQIASSGLSFIEVPVTISYNAYSRAKGQKASDFLAILVDLFARRLHR